MVVFFVFSLCTLSFSKNSKIVFKGLKLFSENELVKILNLKLRDTSVSNTRLIISRVKNFYIKNHYTQIEIYKLPGKDGNVHLFIDEGRLGKIIVKGLNTYNSLKVKQVFRIPRNIYNSEVLNINLRRLKESFLTSTVAFELRKVNDYSGNFFQLDRELKSIEILDYNVVRLFDDFSPAYDLYVHVKKQNGFLKGRDNSGIWGVGIRLGFPSEIKPRIYYRSRNFIFRKDRFRVELSAGFESGIDKLFSLSPEYSFESTEISFTRLKFDYIFSPLLAEVFTPVVKSNIYHSRGSRDDIGFKSYRYLKINEMVAPGFTFLKNINFHMGLAYEFIAFHESTYEEFSPEYGVDENVNGYPYLEMQLKFDPLSEYIGLRKYNGFLFKYNEFFIDVNSSEFEFQFRAEKEFSNLSIFSIKLKANLMFRDVPFYHQNNMNSDFFKGFTGMGYYSSKQISVSTEYRFSLYQDYVYGGFYGDYIRFESYGEILDGNKSGVVAGPLLRILFYDQFEFQVYGGWDRLFPDGESQGNLKMKLSKKW